MPNLRLKRIRTVDNRTIRAQFTEPLITTLVTGNVSITPLLDSIPTPSVLELSINGDIMDITVQPLTPFALYEVEFKSTNTIRFRSINGNYLFEDGKTNIVQIKGAASLANSIKTNLVDNLTNQIYNLDDNNLISSIVETQSDVLSKALYAIGQTANENYLEHLVVDELYTRGEGPYDRLNQESAFEVVRVGLTKTDYTKTTSISLNPFPSDVITLKNTPVSEEILTAGEGLGTFDNIILTVRKSPITKVTAITINYEDGSSVEYPIEQYGYRIQDSTYDKSYASTLYTLENNQIQLNEDIFGTNIIPPAVGDTVTVSYEYKSLGRQIDPDSVVVSEIVSITREVCPPITTEFSLEHSPIVTSEDILSSIAGVEFLNPRACIPFSETHPAFAKEIPFRLEGLPSVVGEYCIDYENGRVFVYGETTNDGTGNYPPIASYKYRSSYVANLDYTYNPETGDLAASPLRYLIGTNSKITFSYEDSLVPGVDYNANIHIESIDERIDNRLVSLGSLHTKYSPITDVFRVINETSGEIYSVNRFNDTTVFFSYNIPPRILPETRERASFTDVLNEQLIKSSESTNILGTRVFKVPLIYNRIVAASEDCIGSAFNTSVSFSRLDIFTTEIYYDSQILSETENTNKLLESQYCINYSEGIIYVGVSTTQTMDVGTVNYKAPIITTNNPHIISVSKIYKSLGVNYSTTIDLDYESFNDTQVIPTTLGLSNERFLNGDETIPYVYDNGTITVTSDIKDIRGIYDGYDLNNHPSPINFGPLAAFSGNVITLSGGIPQQVSAEVSSGSEVILPIISAGMSIYSVSSVIRISDGVELWDSSGSFVDFTITLSGTGTPVAGDAVFVNYTVELNGAATPVVDYNHGDYYIDYNYLADEILVSYEYGDNVIDFRESTTVAPGTSYYVTYKVGALRDALLANFGSQIDLPIMSSFDTSFDRERYRDALQGAMQSFLKGPTIPSMKSLVSNITKIDPEIIESIFQVWSLGISSLYQSAIDYTGEPTLISGKFDNGMLLDSSSQSVFIPMSSNLRLEEGSLEFWAIPEWDGVDNDATLTLSDLFVGSEELSSDQIWIGARSYHPTITDGSFTVSRFDDNDPKGLPYAIHTETGMFIYYDDTAKRWQLLVKNVNGCSYSGKVYTSGEFYDVKYIPDLGESTDVLRSLTDEIEFELNINAEDTTSPDGYKEGDGYVAGYSFDGITFMSDDKHYLIDVADPESLPEGLIGTYTSRAIHPKELEALRRKSKNRMAIYKDGRGFLSFEVFDKNSSLYKISADISTWAAGEKHLIGATWKINTPDHRDEIHLFVDGVEVPNILRYGGRPAATIGDRFRTVRPELVVGTISKKIIKGSDLTTTAGSYIVTSASTDFEAEGILAGDTITILEIGFDEANITLVDGYSLTLDIASLTSYTDARFATNVFSATVSNDVYLASNIAVSILDGDGYETEIPGLRATFPSYILSKNGLLQTVLTLYGPAEAGDSVLIRTLGLNYKRYRDSMYVWGNTQSIIKTQLPPPINLDDVSIKKVILPLVSIGPDNASIVGSDFVASGIIPTSVTNIGEGRQLSIRMTGDNVDWGTAATVVITGTSTGGVTETVTFTSATTQNTVNNWQTITDITVTVTPISLLIDSSAIEIKETLTITDPGINNNFPVIRYVYQEDNGEGLSSLGDGYISGGGFIDIDLGKKIVITAPIAAAGTYEITYVGEGGDGYVGVDPAPIAFTDGYYVLYNTIVGRSGFQNGFFYFELAGSVNTPYLLTEGIYEFDYASWLNIPWENVNNHKIYIGSDFYAANQAKAIIDEFRVLSTQITDVRIGETASATTKNFTSDYIAIRPFTPDWTTLILVHFDNLPFVNVAPFYKIAYKGFLQSTTSVNSNFDTSLVINELTYKIDNTGLLSTRSEGTIEFWISPKYETFNDPVDRFYFDATSAVTETVTSTNSGSVQIAGSAGSILSVKLATDKLNKNKDYYTAKGVLQNDKKTINLGIGLPNANTPVVVTYIPNGYKGDRISILKDKYGFLSFNVMANGTEYQVRQPIFWQKDSWHRILASFKFNRKDNQDELRLFVDGRESGTVRYGSGLLYGQGVVYGQGRQNGLTSRLIANIDFTDIINEFYIGSNFQGLGMAQARFDNFKISNISRPPLMCSGIPVDENYQANTDNSLPVVEDLYTLYLNNFDKIISENKDFAILRDQAYGIFNFIINVIDSFGIVENDEKINQVLMELISALKPANSKVTVNVLR